jgi:hypothetical protein
LGDRYSLTETKAMIKEDPSMLDDFTDEELVEMKASLEELRRVKRAGVRANNQAAIADADFTLNQLSEKVRQNPSLVLVLNDNLDQRFGGAHGDDRLRHVHPGPHPRSSAYSHH